ncbi:fatty acyl-CoA reductase 1-like [Bicyclus anynana]|uniref:Fatty acyl-CoA reductase n=1 Tax=Bicyclus anynana TaxID=110368 RepID=A0A6J1MR73_BICAN|nr:fatty acyl-CoA reductase 1-like [Bicyclus anynana]
MTFLEDRDLDGVPTIPEYYRGKTIFITGGTGFMGKVLLEKLLYSCSDLDRIYLLLRPKKGVKPENRLAALYASPCYDRLRRERPGVFESKVYFVAGDCSEIGLGLSEEDRTLIVNRTQIIFHVAASVRFDDPLKVAANLNLRGTREMIELAKEVQNLECFVHVSTTYCNTNRDPIEEILYPPLADWRETLEICESLDDKTVNILSPKYLGEMPNTYVFTKQLAEHVVNEQRGKLPIVIIRPSVVISSYEEPMPGWIENFNGPVGILVASGKGILRTLYCNPVVTADYIPVDVAIRGFIAASWIRGTKKFEPMDDIPIYHSCASSLNQITTGEIFDVGHKIIATYPLDDIIMGGGGSITDSKFIYSTKVILLHVLPALLIDTLLWICGKKTMVLKIQRRIYSANCALAYYLTQQWSFSNQNFIYLRSKLKDEDKEQFYYEIKKIDRQEFYKHSCIGARRYLLKEKDEDLPKARAHYNRVMLFDKLITCLFYGCLLWWVLRSQFLSNVIDKFL